MSRIFLFSPLQLSKRVLINFCFQVALLYPSPDPPNPLFSTSPSGNPYHDAITCIVSWSTSPKHLWISPLSCLCHLWVTAPRPAPILLVSLWQTRRYAVTKNHASRPIHWNSHPRSRPDFLLPPRAHRFRNSSCRGVRPCPQPAVSPSRRYSSLSDAVVDRLSASMVLWRYAVSSMRWCLMQREGPSSLLATSLLVVSTLPPRRFQPLGRRANLLY